MAEKFGKFFQVNDRLGRLERYILVEGSRSFTCSETAGAVSSLGTGLYEAAFAVMQRVDGPHKPAGPGSMLR